MISRNKLLNEATIRKYVKKLVDETKEQYLFEQKTEQLLREYIRKVITEVTADSIDDEAIHKSTGINVLEDLLKKIIPVLEEDYKNLTTDIVQRKSFRAHILNAIQNLLKPASALVKDELAAGDAGGGDPGLAEEGVNIDIAAPGGETGNDLNDSPADPENFIDITKKKSKEIRFPQLSGEDETGRNMAMKTFDKIEKNILDSYGILSNEEDQNVFYDYLLTNIKMYFSKFEDELKSVVKEPTTPSYEKAVSGGDTAL